METVKKGMPLAVKSIRQLDGHTFAIDWSDGAVIRYRLSDLQRQCPCASCVDETSGKRIMDPNLIREDVKATRIVSVGRYALQIFFTSGCSNGIYGFDTLRSMKMGNENE